MSSSRLKNMILSTNKQFNVQYQSGMFNPECCFQSAAEKQGPGLKRSIENENSNREWNSQRECCLREGMFFVNQERKNSLNILFSGGIFLGHQGPRRRSGRPGFGKKTNYARKLWAEFSYPVPAIERECTMLNKLFPTDLISFELITECPFPTLIFWEINYSCSEKSRIGKLPTSNIHFLLYFLGKFITMSMSMTDTDFKLFESDWN